MIKSAEANLDYWNPLKENTKLKKGKKQQQHMDDIKRSTCTILRLYNKVPFNTL